MVRGGGGRDGRGRVWGRRSAAQRDTVAKKASEHTMVLNQTLIYLQTSQRETGNGVEPAGMLVVMSGRGGSSDEHRNVADGFRFCSMQRGNPPQNAPYLLHYGWSKNGAKCSM